MIRKLLGEHNRCKGEWGGVTWKAGKSRSSTDWKLLAEMMATKAGLEKDAFDRLVHEQTKTKPGARSLRVNVKDASE